MLSNICGITKLIKSTPQQILLRFSNLNDLPIGVIETDGHTEGHIKRLKYHI